MNTKHKLFVQKMPLKSLLFLITGFWRNYFRENPVETSFTLSFNIFCNFLPTRIIENNKSINLSKVL